MSGLLNLICFECHSALTRPVKYTYGSIGSKFDHEGVCPFPVGHALIHKTRQWDIARKEDILANTIWVHLDDLKPELNWDGCNYDWVINCVCGNPIGFAKTDYWAVPYFEPDLKSTYFWPYKQNNKTRNKEIKEKEIEDIKSIDAFKKDFDSSLSLIHI